MCHRFTMLTYEETQDVVRALSCGTHPAWKPDWPASAPRVDAFPGSRVGIIVPNASGGVETVEATWGFAAPWAKRPVFNARIETALSPESGMWGRALAQGRCIVPAVRFFETQNRPDVAGVSDGAAKGRRRSLYSFGMPDGDPVLLAGMRQDGCFSVVTTQPNASVAPVHDRMPLVLSWYEAWRWLGDGFASLADRGAVVLDSRLEQQPARRSRAVVDGQMSLF